MYVWLSPSPSLFPTPSLLSAAAFACIEAADIVAQVFTMCRKACGTEALFCVPVAVVILHQAISMSRR